MCFVYTSDKSFLATATVATVSIEARQKLGLHSAGGWAFPYNSCMWVGVEVVRWSRSPHFPGYAMLALKLCPGML